MVGAWFVRKNVYEDRRLLFRVERLWLSASPNDVDRGFGEYLFRFVFGYVEIGGRYSGVVLNVDGNSFRRKAHHRNQGQRDLTHALVWVVF